MDGIRVEVHKMMPSRAAENPVLLSRIRARNADADRINVMNLRLVIGNTSRESMLGQEI